MAQLKKLNRKAKLLLTRDDDGTYALWLGSKYQLGKRKQGLPRRGFCWSEHEGTDTCCLGWLDLNETRLNYVFPGSLGPGGGPVEVELRLKQRA